MGDVSSRVDALETENRALRDLLGKLTIKVESLESRLAKAEGGSTQAAPAAKEEQKETKKADDDDDDDFDMFGSDDEEEERRGKESKRRETCSLPRKESYEN